MFFGVPIILFVTEELSALFFLLVSGVLISVFPIAAVLVLTGIFQIYFALGLWLYSSFTQTQYTKKLFLIFLLLGLLLSAGVSLIFTFDWERQAQTSPTFFVKSLIWAFNLLISSCWASCWFCRAAWSVHSLAYSVAPTGAKTKKTKNAAASAKCQLFVWQLHALEVFKSKLTK